MKHCRNCENCVMDPLNFYLKGLDYHQCVLDGHHIVEPFWEKCGKYRKNKDSKTTCSSWLYHLVDYCRKHEKKKR